MDTTTPAASHGTSRMETEAGRGPGSGPRRAAGPVPDEALDRRYQALSDPKRRTVLALLREGERCVCELVDEMEVSQSLLSFHLKTLKEAGLVDDRRDGRWVHYRTRPEALADLRAHLAALAPGVGEGVPSPAAAAADGDGGACGC